jgi:hypothetical protein
MSTLLRVFATLSLFAMLACSGPTAVFPGGALDGPVKPTPESFGFALDAGTIQLETDPEAPYSVNIACAVVGDALYISAGENKAQWVENMEVDPRVRLRIKGDIYELSAHRVTTAVELDAFAEEWTKNAWARDPRELDEVWVYRLAAR